jgi:hypothetical protein
MHGDGVNAECCTAAIRPDEWCVVADIVVIRCSASQMRMGISSFLVGRILINRSN